VSAAAGPVAERLYFPTYQNRLRVIGRQLDLARCRGLSLLEISGGFLVRAATPDARTPATWEFPYGDFEGLIAGAIAARGEPARPRVHPLLPTGYEDFLRALGHRLDEEYAEAVTVTELDGFVAVGGVGLAAAHGRSTAAPFQWLLRPDDVAALLDEAFRRRAPTAAPAPAPSASALLRRLAALT
jgi:hypothetical protein